MKHFLDIIFFCIKDPDGNGNITIYTSHSFTDPNTLPFDFGEHQIRLKAEPAYAVVRLPTLATVSEDQKGDRLRKLSSSPRRRELEPNPAQFGCVVTD